MNWLPGTSTAPSTPVAVEWTFSGTNRPKLLKMVLIGLYVDFSSSQSQVVRRQNAKFPVVDLQAEGVSTLAPSRPASPTSPLTTLSVERV